MSLTKHLLSTAPLAALLLTGAAYADTRTSVVVGAEGGYGSNPYFDAGGQNSSTGTVILTAAPRVELIGPTSNVNLSGRVEQAFFTSRYSDVTNWSLGADSAVRLSPRTNLTAGASYSSMVNSGLASAIQPLLPLDPLNPILDPTVTENGGLRTKTLAGRIGLDTKVSARDTITLGGTVAKVDYAGAGSSSYTSYSGTGGFSHVFSDRMSGGLTATYAKTDYDQAAFGSFKAFTPAATMSLKLAPRTTLNVSAGVTFNTESRPAAPSVNTTAFTGSAALCHEGDRSNLCISASRWVGATSTAGSSTVNQISANYSYKLSPRSSISVAGNYANTKSTSAISAYDFSYISTSATYDHQLMERLSLTVKARYTDPIKSTIGRGRSFYGGVGLSYRFGR
ncbi:MAG: outer membrane beta-barrel protein [Sphingobium sp.]|nr:outer membrane beta-barrel protein [Sphingobium sp.]